ncbi:methyl-accepting chemotaxis protein [Cohnella sp.]|uniref:methyl-accepting chemotaxis protein n=1 Tax=Cohnella sp. TaxID=1883426 RepID=UPI00356AD25C
MSRKLIGAFVAISLIVALTSLLSYFFVQRIHQSSSDLMNRHSNVLTQVAIIQNMTESQKGLLFRYLVEPSEALVQELGTANGKLEAAIKVLSADTSDDDRSAKAQSLIEYNQTFARLVAKVTDYVAQGKPELARTEALMWAVPTTDSLSKSASAIQENERAFMSAAESDNQSRVDVTVLILIGVSVLSLLLAIVIGWLLSRMMVAPMKRLVVAAGEIASGNLTGEDIIVRNRDELGKLAEAFNGMKGNLQGLIRQAGSNAGQVADTAEGLRKHSERLGGLSEGITEVIGQIAAGSEKQLLNVQQGVTEMGNMSLSTSEIEQATGIVSERSLLALEAANAGKHSIGQAKRQMETIRGQMDGLASAVQRLTKRTEQITQATNVISTIARQTNMLALNAAIEASRAGIQGKGFAVVAEEVRKLSGQTAIAAEEVGSITDSIQREMAEVAASADSGYREVSVGIEIVNQADGAFARIEGAVDGVAHQVKEMTMRSAEMARNSHSAAAAIESIRQVTEQTASGARGVTDSTEEQFAAMEEIIASAVLLSKEAEMLQGRIAQFRVSR